MSSGRSRYSPPTGDLLGRPGRPPGVPHRLGVESSARASTEPLAGASAPSATEGSVNQHSAAAIIGLLLLAPTAPVAAQQPPDLPQALARVDPSETVTILDTDGRRLVGRVAQVSSSGLTLVQRGQATSVPLQRVARSRSRIRTETGRPSAASSARRSARSAESP
jgi:hypothetical protein